MKRKTETIKNNLTASMLLTALLAVPAMLHGQATGLLLDEDFTNPAFAGSVGGGLIATSFDQPIGNGTYRGEGSGILGLLVRPQVSIVPTQGEARFDNILTTTVLFNVVGNDARLYRNDIGHIFGQDLMYTFDVFFRSDNLVTAQLLSGKGFGIQLLANGTEVASSPANVALANIEIFGDGMSGKIRLDYTAAAGDHLQSIGVGAFVGRDQGLLSAAVFDHLVITKMELTAIPEPSSVAALLAGLAFAVVIGCRLRSGRKGKAS